MDLFRSRAGVFNGIRDDEGDDVAVADDLLFAQQRARRMRDLGARLRDILVDHIVAADGVDVLRRDDADNAGHFFSLGGVDAENFRVVRDARLDGRDIERTARHLHADILAVVRGAADLCQRARARELGIVIALALAMELDVLHGRLAAHDLCRRHDCVDDLLIAGAAAVVVVLFEPRTHVLARRIQILLEQGVGGDDKARDAEAALDAAVGDERLLKRMQVHRGADALNGHDLGKFGDGLHLFDARLDDLAIQKDGADTAYADAAARLYAGQTEAAQKIGEGVLFRVADDHAVCAVDVEPEFTKLHGCSSYVSY